MKIVYKHILKNIFAKPFRTILLVFCITVCAWVAAFSLDFTSNLEAIVKNMLMQITGSADMVVTEELGMNETFSFSYDTNQLLIYENNAAIIERINGNYAFYKKKEYSVEYFDYDIAMQMQLLSEELNLKDDETAISQVMAKSLDLKVGDTITLLDDADKEHTFTIQKVMAPIGIMNGKKIALLNKASFTSIYKDTKANIMYLDVKDDTSTKAVKEEIEKINPNVQVNLFMDSEENKVQMKTFKMLFLLIFAICFFLVIFVTMSVSKRIINERMSVVGTFRSLGMSPAFTTKMLLIENAFYGMLGAGIGIGLYCLIRESLFQAIVTPQVSGGIVVTMNSGEMKVGFMVLIFIMSILVECACPLKEILVASKMSIRDIIFDNKDTAFRMSTTSKVIGLIALITAIVTFIIAKKMELLFLCFVCCVVAVSQLFPLVLKWISSALSKIFHKFNMPIAQLAAKECYARKSTVGSSVLCLTASMLSIIIFIILSSLNAIYDLHTYDTDLIVTAVDYTKPASFSYIKDLNGVEDIEMIYCKDTEVHLNDAKKDVTVVGMNEENYTQFIAIHKLPETIGHEEFYIDESLARRENIAVGDEVKVTFNSGSFLPMERTLKCAGVVNSFDVNTTCNTIVIAKSLYLECYQDYIAQVLVKCDNPNAVKEKIETYSSANIAQIQTNEEYYQGWQDKKKGMKGMFLVVIIIGVGLTVIGMISNQLIGFEGRKRECAVLVSTSMTRGKCEKMLFLESLIASGCSLFVAFFVAMITYIPVGKLFVALGVELPIEYNVVLYTLFLSILWIVFTLVSLFPIRSLHKMKLALQLKYE